MLMAEPHANSELIENMPRHAHMKSTHTSPALSAPKVTQGSAMSLCLPAQETARDREK